MAQSSPRITDERGCHPGLGGQRRGPTLHPEDLPRPPARVPSSLLSARARWGRTQGPGTGRQGRRLLQPRTVPAAARATCKHGDTCG